MTNKEVKTETWLNLTPPNAIKGYFTPIRLELTTIAIKNTLLVIQHLRADTKYPSIPDIQNIIDFLFVLFVYVGGGGVVGPLLL